MSSFFYLCSAKGFVENLERVLKMVSQHLLPPARKRAWALATASASTALSLATTWAERASENSYFYFPRKLRM